MLVLTRKHMEAVVINPGSDQEVTVRVVRLCNGEVRLAFEARREIKVFREELLKGERDGKRPLPQA